MAAIVADESISLLTLLDLAISSFLKSPQQKQLENALPKRASVSATLSKLCYTRLPNNEAEIDFVLLPPGKFWVNTASCWLVAEV